MAHTKVETESKLVTEVDPVSEWDRQLLGAALAAVLVEHRRRVMSGSDLPRLDSTGTGWRMMARWGQLVDPAHVKLQGRP
jgi:hypothetical protein